jgi:hypothetical protein
VAKPVLRPDCVVAEGGEHALATRPLTQRGGQRRARMPRHVVHERPPRCIRAPMRPAGHARADMRMARAPGHDTGDAARAGPARR